VGRAQSTNGTRRWLRILQATRARAKPRRLSVWLGTATAIVALATGVLTLRDQIFGTDPEPPGPGPGPPTTVPYFGGVAGHLERSDDLIDFLKNHDRDAVRMQVGFRIGLEDFSVKGFGTEPYEPGDDPRVDLYTDCTPPLSTSEREQVELGFSDVLPPPRCMVWQLWVGPDTDESRIYVTHGTPRLEGYFVVDIGDLHMGYTPVTLKPQLPRGQGAYLTFASAAPGDLDSPRGWWRTSTCTIRCAW
jgi:hypothetical protein